MKKNREVLRTCCGCRQQKPKAELIRLYLDEQEQVCIDRTGKSGGRGVYLCADRGCLERALKTGAVGRGLKKPVSAQEVAQVWPLT